MEQFEKIKVYIKIERGKTVCVCARRKRCEKFLECEQEIVSRNRFRGWQSTMNRNRFGR